MRTTSSSSTTRASSRRGCTGARIAAARSRCGSRECSTRFASRTHHVGAGTFQPVRVDEVSRHVMHSEWYAIPQATVDAIAATRKKNGRVVAVGTTALCALEAAAAIQEEGIVAGAAETRI